MTGEARARRRGRFSGLRAKLILICILLVCIPFGVVWSFGIYDIIHQRLVERELALAGQSILNELKSKNTSLVDLTREGAWLDAFARKHHIMLRMIDPHGNVLQRTDPWQAERWSTVIGLFRESGKIFFGNPGPPDLLAYEAGLPVEADRLEVKSALSGTPYIVWRFSEHSRMVICYYALPMLKNQGALYLTRVSWRGIRALYWMRYQLMKLTLVICGIAVMFGIWAGWIMVKPILQMQTAIANYLRNPSLDMTDALNLHRKDELGDLAAHIAELTQRLQQRSQEAEQLAGDLAHDLKNPIATVRASAEFLADMDTPDERIHKIGASLENVSAHMHRSVDGLLHLARLDASFEHGPRHKVDMNQLLERLVAEFQPHPGSAAYTLTFEPRLDSAFVFGIEARLAQAMGNIIENAVSFCKTRVSITLDPGARNSLTIMICDDGPGVSPGNQDKIFRRFFSYRPPDHSAGTGLGLSMARKVILAHNGTLALATAGPLPGACFHIVLPRLAN